MAAVEKPAAAVAPVEVDGLVAYWNAADYLTVAQIYLHANPLLRKPLRPEHLKSCRLGHRGTVRPHSHAGHGTLATINTAGQPTQGEDRSAGDANSENWSG
jgi:phosphoketolase